MIKVLTLGNLGGRQGVENSPSPHVNSPVIPMVLTVYMMHFKRD